MKPAGLYVGVATERLVQGLGRRQPLDIQFAEGAIETSKRARSILVVDDQLAEQAVVEWRHRVAGIEHAVETHPVAAWHGECGDGARVRGEAFRWVLGVDADLERVAIGAHLILADAQGFAAGNPDHLAHQVYAGDHFRYWMFDLDARVHLQEVKFVTAVIVQIFDRPRAAVVHRLGERDGRRTELVANGGPQWPRGGFFPHFLTASLPPPPPLAASAYTPPPPPPLPPPTPRPS